jgi:hypothetical protein
VTDISRHRCGRNMLEKKEFLRMLSCISILAGLLIMMWQHARGEALFYYFGLKKNKYQRITVAAER